MPSDCPVIVLTSGQTLKIQSVKLFNASKVNEIASLKAAAVQNMGGVSTGIGFWGSPAWVLGGAAALNIIEGLATKANRRAGIDQIRMAESAYREMLRGAKYFEATAISNLQSPHPDAWAAACAGHRFVHNGDAFVEIGTDLGALSVRWSEVVAYYPIQAAAASFEVEERIPTIGAAPAPVTSWRPPRSLMIECKNCGRESIPGTRTCPDCNHPL